MPDFAASESLAAGDPPALTPRDWRLLDQVDGRRDVAALAAVLDEPLEDVAASVQSLQAAAILELRRPAPDAGAVARAAIEAGRYEEAARLLRARLASIRTTSRRGARSGWPKSVPGASSAPSKHGRAGVPAIPNTPATLRH